jgi:vitamin B12 transporter
MKEHCFKILCITLLNILISIKVVEVHAQTRIMSASSDSIPAYQIGEVVVTENQKNTETESSTPLQLLNRDALKDVNALQVSDAVNFFSGVTVKDYGGIGGIKTVSVRSMGAHHTAVVYDGITVTDCQTGQIDIGRYSLEDVEVLSLNIGDGNTIFQPARMFASSGLLTIQTKHPVFENGDNFHGKVGFKTGSFGLLNPSLLLERKINPFFDLNFSAEGLYSKGNYPYKLFYSDAADAYTTERRENNAIRTCRFESTLFGHLKKGQQLEVKAYYYQSDRGLPGAVILYNLYSTRQHLWDKNAFLQAHYEQDLSKKLVFQVNEKYNWSYQRYLNPEYLSSTGKEDNSYHQEESYLSSSLLFKACQGFSFAFSSDGAINSMQSNLYDFSPPTRYTVLANFSAKYLNEWMFATAGILGTAIHEERASADVAGNHQRLSPAVSFSIKPFSEKEFHIRFFYKASFRMPSFNDLYYSAIGNSELNPENSKQLNLGLTYGSSFGKGWPQIQVTSDIYHNHITDKIMAIPTKNIFIWSMVNLGKVEINGIDLSLSATQLLGNGYRLSAAFNHTYQQALDVTDATAKEYKNQIAYAPRVFGSARLSLEMPWAKVACSMLYSGHRYVTGQNLEVNNLSGYKDYSVSAERDIHLRRITLNLRVEVLNLLNENYEIVRNFPMPGRSYRVGLKFEF